jgi:hypothetical protein
MMVGGKRCEGSESEALCVTERGIQQAAQTFSDIDRDNEATSKCGSVHQLREIDDGNSMLMMIERDIRRVIIEARPRRNGGGPGARRIEWMRERGRLSDA